MDNWLANIVDNVNSLHVEIDILNNPLVGFCFIRNLDISYNPSTPDDVGMPVGYPQISISGLAH
jgi:hypothetical protein